MSISRYNPHSTGRQTRAPPMAPRLGTRFITVMIASALQSISLRAEDHRAPCQTVVTAAKELSAQALLWLHTYSWVIPIQRPPSQTPATQKWMT